MDFGRFLRSLLALCAYSSHLFVFLVYCALCHSDTPREDIKTVYLPGMMLSQKCASLAQACPGAYSTALSTGLAQTTIYRLVSLCISTGNDLCWETLIKLLQLYHLRSGFKLSDCEHVFVSSPIVS
jgi:hypothetical protein